MGYSMFDGDDDLSFFVVSCHNTGNVRKLIAHYSLLGYDCSSIKINEKAAPNVIVRTKDMVLLPCGASMSAALASQGISFKEFIDIIGEGTSRKA
jgi:hypothetical protein